MSSESFAALFGMPPVVTARAPGRVNLLGEHTDYNAGYVLPTATPQSTEVQLAPSRDARNRFHSAQLGESVEYGEGEEPPQGFARYVHGCMAVLRERGVRVAPLSMHIRSSVPIGAGLSSSAALEVAVLRGLRELLQLPLDDVELARIAQQAEVRFARVNCGIMDQMAASLADTEHMLFLDTRTLERRTLPLPAPAELIVLDSGVPRTLAASGYNARRAECERAAAALGVAALRDVTDPAAARTLPPPLDRRARHVITENARVLQAVRGVGAAEFGALMSASHASLRDDFEVSTTALDRLVELLQQHPGVHGARLTGAGFGGACVALARPEAAGRVRAEVLEAYRRAGFGGAVLV